MTTMHQAAQLLGRRGGSVKNPSKGYGSATPQQRTEWAKRAVEGRRRNQQLRIDGAVRAALEQLMDAVMMRVAVEGIENAIIALQQEAERINGDHMDGNTTGI